MTEVVVPEIDVHDLMDQIDAGALVLDVRRRDEFEAGHIPGALHIPLDELADRAAEVPAVGSLYVVCHSGGRSRAASAFLLQRGTEAVNVAGGTAAWIAAGYDIATGADPA